MRNLWGIKSSDFLYAGLHTLVWIVVYFLVFEVTKGNGKELANALIAGWFSALYLTVFYHIRWHAWSLAFIFYFLFGATIEYTNTYTLFHLDALDQFDRYAIIATHAFVFAGPIMFNKMIMSLLAGKRN